MSELIVFEVGKRSYDCVHQLQKKLHAEVVADPSKSYLIIVEHEPVFTIGKFGDEKNILSHNGIPVRRIERGGDVTYHGPGQLVLYPIVNLFRLKLGIKDFVRKLELCIVKTLAKFGIDSGHKDCCIGVFAGDYKIASLGLAVSRGVTYHGAAINVKTDLTPFSYINPCGFKDLKVTSMKAVLDNQVDLDEVVHVFKQEFAKKFKLNPMTASEVDFQSIQK